MILFYIQCVNGETEIKKFILFFFCQCKYIILRGKHFLAAHFLFPSNNSNVERGMKKDDCGRGGWPIRLKRTI